MDVTCHYTLPTTNQQCKIQEKWRFQVQRESSSILPFPASHIWLPKAYNRIMYLKSPVLIIVDHHSFFPTLNQSQPVTFSTLFYIIASRRSWRSTDTPDTSDKSSSRCWRGAVGSGMVWDYNDLTVLPNPGNHVFFLMEIIPFYGLNSGWWIIQFTQNYPKKACVQERSRHDVIIPTMTGESQTIIKHEVRMCITLRMRGSKSHM